MKSVKLLVILTTLMWIAVRFFLRPLVVKHNLFDFWFTESYPSFGLIFGFTLTKYSFFNTRDRLWILCCGATLGGLLYEILGQGYFDFGTFSYSDVVYTLIGGVASYLTLKHFERYLNNA